MSETEATRTTTTAMDPLTNHKKHSVVTDWIVALSAIGTLIIGVVALLNSIDDSDIKQAVRNLSSLAAETKRQADVSQTQVLALAREETGWVAPDNFLVRLIDTDTISFEIAYKNIGNSPSTREDIRESLAWLILSRIPQTLADIEPERVKRRLDVRLNLSQQCQSLKPGTIAQTSKVLMWPKPLKPSAFPYILHLKNEVSSPIAVFRAQAVLQLFGCITYRSLGVEHHTAFCQDAIPFGVYPNVSWDYSYCNSGNDAD